MVDYGYDDEDVYEWMDRQPIYPISPDCNREEHRRCADDECRCGCHDDGP
jgi:hypothetical protein